MSVPSAVRSSLLGTLTVFTAVALMAGCSDDERTDEPEPTPADAGFDPMDAVVVMDADPVDTGPIDTGTPDSGEAPDMGFVDMGFPDMGFPDSGVFADAEVPMGDAGVNLTCDPTFFPAGACGGNLAGTTWIYRDVCGDSSLVNQFANQTCPGSTILNVNRTITGTVSFGTNATFQITGTDRSVATVVVAQLCVTVAGGCGQVASFLNMFAIPATCATVGGNCQCDIDFEESLARSGDFNVNGNQFRTVNSGGTQADHDFCVNMGALRYSDTTEQRTFVLSP